MASDITRERPHPPSVSNQNPPARFRSVPYRQPFVHAVFFSASHFIGILAVVTTLVAFLIQPSKLATRVLILFIGFCAVSWLIAFFKRRSAHCPLCKGTPLFDTGALPHKKAVRLFPFNHGITAILSIIATQKFRCMDCGTNYDLLKTPAHLRHHHGRTDDEDYD